MQVQRWVCIVFSLFLLTGAARAENMVYYPAAEAPIFSIAFPDDWVVEQKNGQVSANPPDESMLLLLWTVAGAENQANALQMADELLAELFTDIEFDEPETTATNGIEIFQLNGRGQEKDGTTVEIGMDIFSPDDGETFCVLQYYGTPEAWEAYEAEIALIAESLARYDEAAESEAVDDGDFQIVFEPPQDQKMQPFYKVVTQRGRFAELVNDLNDTFALPQDITIHFQAGDPNDVFYDPAARQIVISYEFVAFITAVFRANDYITAEDAPENIGPVMDVVEEALYHEIGHALVHVLDIPMTGKEEDAVDALAAVMISLVLEEPENLIPSAHFYAMLADARTEIAEEEFWDEHALHEQRYYNLICWVYGSDPEKFADIIAAEGLGRDRADQCPAEYQQLAKSWLTLLTPFLK